MNDPAILESFDLGAAADSWRSMCAGTLRWTSRRCPTRGSSPIGRLWHAATVLREYRGDGHVAALVAAQVDGVECHRLHGGAHVSQQREFRGWTEQEWADAAERLRCRGLLDEAGEKTSLGRELRAEIERSTDRSAAAALCTLDDAELRVVRDALDPVARPSS